MDYDRNSSNSQPLDKQINSLTIKQKDQNRLYPHLQAHISQLQKCQNDFGQERQDQLFKTTNLTSQVKNSSRKEKLGQEQKIQKNISIPQKIHQQFIQQKQKEFVKFLTLCLTIISLIVIIVEQHKQKKYTSSYDY